MAAKTTRSLKRFLEKPRLFFEARLEIAHGR